MPRKPIIAANWKMNVTPSEAERFVNEFLPKVIDRQEIEIVLCPPAPSLDRVSNSLAHGVVLGGQNIHFEDSGAYTGENSASMLLDLHCKYTLIGHSERRALFNETDKIVNKKLKHALASGLHSIVCVGENLEERENNQTEDILKGQVSASLNALSAEDFQKIVIAYEPVWAIGTGKTASPEQAEEAHIFIRSLLKTTYGEEVADSTRIQYGGSVKPSNIKELMQKEDIDGALVGGASLKADSFAELINYNI